MPLIDSLPQFRLHLLSLPEQHYAGTVRSCYTCPVAWWLMCETGDWGSDIQVIATHYRMTRGAYASVTPLWVRLFVESIDPRRFRNGRHMVREEALEVLDEVERTLSQRLLPVHAASVFEWQWEMVMYILGERDTWGGNKQCHSHA